MSLNLLVVYEIAEKASRVTSKAAYREFERWVLRVMATCHDAAVERAARIQLFKLREQFSM
jgi:hypothetical protein